MPEDNGRKVAKTIALLFVTGWLIITISLSLESIPAVSPPFYGAYTAVAFLLVGRLWDLEVSKLLPSGGKRN